MYVLIYLPYVCNIIGCTNDHTESRPIPMGRVRNFVCIVCKILNNLVTRIL